MKQDNKPDRTYEGQKSSSVPSISLPKGGGAIHGMGEKFAANPATGTGSMSVPIATSPGRSGFGPQLSLAYDSGAGNGPFGFGWSLSLPSITRKTDKGLPRYLDAIGSDDFALSGAEDLVPVLRQNADGDFVCDQAGKYVVHEDSRDGFTVRRYRPRIEGLFARIERWTSPAGEVHWRSISKDNILTLYGKDSNSRIANSDKPQCISNLEDNRVVQQLHYTYDPSGNITEIYDEAYEPVFFDNQEVEPRSSYTYGALYRLIEATGRENSLANAAPDLREPSPPATAFPTDHSMDLERVN